MVQITDMCVCAHMHARARARTLARMHVYVILGGMHWIQSIRNRRIFWISALQVIYINKK